MKKYLSIAILFILLVACGSPKLSQQERALRTLQVQQSIGSGNYKIEVNRVSPLRGKTTHLTGDYSLEIRNDSAFAYLPYFGRSYQASFSDWDGGIKFAEKMSDYSVESGKNADRIIKFKIRDREVHYSFRVTISERGNSYIQVIPAQKDPISFDGEMVWDIQTSGKDN